MFLTATAIMCKMWIISCINILDQGQLKKNCWSSTSHLLFKPDVVCMCVCRILNDAQTVFGDVLTVPSTLEDAYILHEAQWFDLLLVRVNLSFAGCNAVSFKPLREFVALIQRLVSSFWTSPLQNVGHA